MPANRPAGGERSRRRVAPTCTPTHIRPSARRASRSRRADERNPGRGGGTDDNESEPSGGQGNDAGGHTHASACLLAARDAASLTPASATHRALPGHHPTHARRLKRLDGRHRRRGRARRRCARRLRPSRPPARRAVRTRRSLPALVAPEPAIRSKTTPRRARATTTPAITCPPSSRPSTSSPTSAIPAFVGEGSRAHAGPDLSGSAALRSASSAQHPDLQVSTTVRNHLGLPLERHRGRPRRRAGRRRFAARERGRRARRPSRTPFRSSMPTPPNAPINRESVEPRERIDEGRPVIRPNRRHRERVPESHESGSEPGRARRNGREGQSQSRPIRPDHRLWSGDQ